MTSGQHRVQASVKAQNHEGDGGGVGSQGEGGGWGQRGALERMTNGPMCPGLKVSCSGKPLNAKTMAASGTPGSGSL